MSTIEIRVRTAGQESGWMGLAELLDALLAEAIGRDKDNSEEAAELQAEPTIAESLFAGLAQIEARLDGLTEGTAHQLKEVGYRLKEFDRRSIEVQTRLNRLDRP